MPPKGTVTAHKNQLAASREALAKKHQSLASETASLDLWNQLQAANSRIAQLEIELSREQSQSSHLQSELAKSSQKCADFKKAAVYWRGRHNQTYNELRVQRQATARGSTQVDKLKEQIAILQTAEKDVVSHLSSQSKQFEKDISSLKKENSKLSQELSHTLLHWTSQLNNSQAKLQASRSSLTEMRKRVSCLHKAVTGATGVKEWAISAAQAKVTKERTQHKMLSKGVFTPETRNLVHLLVKAGCSRNHISEVITAVLQSGGITTVGSITRSSIARII